MSELIITSSAYIIPGDSPMTSVANTVAMTYFAVHTLQPLIFYIMPGPGPVIPTLDMYLPLSNIWVYTASVFDTTV